MALPPVRWDHGIDVEFRSHLAVRHGQMVQPEKGGEPVHAATFIRRRLMLLERPLLNDHRELRRVLIHELFHFAWVRLSNTQRKEWEELLMAETSNQVKGELGWSAEWRKDELSAADRRNRTRLWREYACESFCDTAAWRYSRLASHDEFTLAQRWCARRGAHFDRLTLRPLAL
jgi:hypothetical protein